MSDVGEVEAAKHIRVAVETLERTQTEAGTRRDACKTLAYHHLMDAYTLLLKGRLTPDDFMWASQHAAKRTRVTGV